MRFSPPHRLVTIGVVATLITTVVWTAQALGSASAPALTPDGSGLAPARRGPVRVVAVGDIACPPGSPVTRDTCHQARTAALARRMSPDAVFGLGDLQYSNGGLNAFDQVYARTWGRLKRITYPVPGNHEYQSPGARGYYAYFARRQPGPPGWYAHNFRAWRVYFLNSNCDKVDCHAQAKWLKRNIRTHRRACSAVAMHHPRFSSGQHGDDMDVRRFFRIAANHHVELFLSGHDHDYERFARLGPKGRRDPQGTVQFVAGTGGRSFYGFGTPQRGSKARVAFRFGVLRLSLGHHGAGFAFTTVGGRVRDAGRIRCR